MYYDKLGERMVKLKVMVVVVIAVGGEGAIISNDNVQLSLYI